MCCSREDLTDFSEQTPNKKKRVDSLIMHHSASASLTKLSNGFRYAGGMNYAQEGRY